MIEITIMPYEKETMYQNSNFKKNIRGSLRRRVGYHHYFSIATTRSSGYIGLMQAHPGLWHRH